MIKICKKLAIILPIIIVLLSLVYLIIFKINENRKGITYIDLDKLTYKNKESSGDIKIYSDYDIFKIDFINNSLPDIYITKFLFDGVDMYKPYDLDDFIEKGNDYSIDALSTNVLNIKSLGDYELNGKFSGMLAINTNDLKGKINIILNNVTIDSDSKKIPAIYVYNKDITYTDCKVTIKTKEESTNNIIGGKIKKVSLISIDELSNYNSKYNDNTYETYTNYYGIYNKNEIDNILFAKVTADNEDLMDNDPYYYYKASGAISSDIDIYFEGKGYLYIESKNKEGIESKGNISFVGNTGSYSIQSMDDCINTTTSNEENKNAHNTITIDVESLIAKVSLDADEGDAIDSNGTIIIDGGSITALSHPGQDAGVDSEKGIYINGGTLIATGDMYDNISNESKQNFMVLNFANQINENETVTLFDSNDQQIFSFMARRNYKYLVYSSKELINGTYNLYKNYTTPFRDYYDIKEYTLAYTSLGSSFGPGERPNMPNGERPEIPTGERPEIPTGERPELSNGEMQGMPNNPMDMTEVNPVNKEFVVNGISNIFNGIEEYIGEN